MSVLVFYVTCNDISVIYVTAQMCRRTEEISENIPVELPVSSETLVSDTANGSVIASATGRHRMFTFKKKMV